MKKRVIVAGLAMGLCVSSTVSAKEIYLGEQTISAYSPASNTPTGSRDTCTGHRATEGRTIAVDMHNPLTRYGAKLKIEGFDGAFTVEDCGNLNHYGRDLDVFMDSESDCRDWGVRSRKVWLIVPDKKIKKVKVHIPYEQEKAIIKERERSLALLSTSNENLLDFKTTLEDRYSHKFL